MPSARMFPPEPLFEHLSVSSTNAAANRLGVDVRNLAADVKLGGFTLRRADDLAHRAGAHLDEIWDDTITRRAADVAAERSIYWARVRAYRVRVGLPADDPRHGTMPGYWAGCRQPCCQEARRTYRRARAPKRATTCACCGTDIEQAATGRPRKFCSTACRNRAPR